jgi:hypothetical protein
MTTHPRTRHDERLTRRSARSGTQRGRKRGAWAAASRELERDRTRHHRLALDRALLASGTRLFAGPLWDVAIDDAQSLMGALLARGLAGDDWGEAWRETVADARGAIAPASWGSFALVGAWSP